MPEDAAFITTSGMLRLRGDGAHGVGVGAEVQAREQVDALVVDQVLRMAARLLGRAARHVAPQQLDRPARDVLVVRGQPDRHAGIELPPAARIGAGPRADDADAQRPNARQGQRRGSAG
jgi:hypothetical protein